MANKIPNPTGKGGFQNRKNDINKNGRPSKGKALSDLYKKVLEEKYLKKDENGNEVNTGLKKIEALAQKCFELAMEGSYSHLRELSERAFGKIPEPPKPIDEYDEDSTEMMKKIADLLMTRGIGFSTREENPNDINTVDFKFVVVDEDWNHEQSPLKYVY